MRIEEYQKLLCSSITFQLNSNIFMLFGKQILEREGGILTENCPNL